MGWVSSGNVPLVDLRCPCGEDLGGLAVEPSVVAGWVFPPRLDRKVSRLEKPLNGLVIDSSRLKNSPAVSGGQDPVPWQVTRVVSSWKWWKRADAVGAHELDIQRSRFVEGRALGAVGANATGVRHRGRGVV